MAILPWREHLNILLVPVGSTSLFLILIRCIGIRTPTKDQVVDSHPGIQWEVLIIMIRTGTLEIIKREIQKSINSHDFV
jgi:hypothetical protein